jgi:hypothetical protein
LIYQWQSMLIFLYYSLPCLPYSVSEFRHLHYWLKENIVYYRKLIIMTVFNKLYRKSISVVKMLALVGQYTLRQATGFGWADSHVHWCKLLIQIHSFIVCWRSDFIELCYFSETFWLMFLEKWDLTQEKKRRE